MSITAAIALYAATVATFAIGWQIYTWLSDRRTIVRVKLEHEVRVDEGIDGVLATVVNHGFRPVQVISVGIQGRKEIHGEWRLGAGPDSHRQLRERLESRDSIAAGFLTEDLAMDNLDLDKPLRAMVTLGDGERLYSNEIVIGDSSWAFKLKR